MINRNGGWWRLWGVLAVVWTAAVLASGWLNLPRAQHVPHDPRLSYKLSSESASILTGPELRAAPARGALAWSEVPRFVRMSNGMRLKFPAITTDERVAFVESEYRELLSHEADTQRGPYILELLLLWLAPVFVTGLLMQLFFRSDWYAANNSAICSTANSDGPRDGPQSLA